MLRRIFITVYLILFSSVVNAEVQRQTDEASVLAQAYNSESNVIVELKIHPRDGWYVHSHRPGEFGSPIKVIWSDIADKMLSEEWSEGDDISYQGFNVNVYKDDGLYRAIFPAEVGKKLEFTLQFTACSDECVPRHLDFTLISGSVPDSYLFSRTEKSANNSSLWLQAILLAFIGGLLLNFMPCVFPVLFIKILNVISSSSHSKRIYGALGYLAGVIVSFSAIAAILRFLKSQGQALGWGFQLQSPPFVVTMAIIFFILALMFLDIIKINFSVRLHSINPFLTGLLAVLVASPCSAPFMGAAIGWILTANVPAYMYYSVFCSLGLGYALPFFTADLFPRVLQIILPRPGKWMLWFKRAMAVPMVLTGVWLIWSLQTTPKPNTAKWLPFEQQKMEELVSKGQKVFIDFRANWCLTCLANEKIVLNTAEFSEMAAQRDVVLLKADWTRYDSKITDALSRFGRGSVPLYVYYDGKKYTILPQILTLKILEKTL